MKPWYDWTYIWRNGGEFKAFDSHELHFELKNKQFWNIFVANISWISKSQQSTNFPLWLKSFLEHIEKDTMQTVTKPKRQPHAAGGGSLAWQRKRARTLCLTHSNKWTRNTSLPQFHSEPPTGWPSFLQSGNQISAGTRAHVHKHLPEEIVTL